MEMACLMNLSLGNDYYSTDSFKKQGTRHKVQGTSINVQNPKNNIQKVKKYLIQYQRQRDRLIKNS
jgi:hypothetical protein